MWPLVLKWIATAVIVYALTPKPRMPKDAAPATIDDFDFPTAEDGREIPVLFGTRETSGPNVVWYGDLVTENITEKVDRGPFRSSKRVTVGYKYFLGAHKGLVHGPVDSLNRIRVADKVIWVGAVTESGSIEIEQPEIFGGTDTGGEGGIEGTFTFHNGEPTLLPSTYLQEQLGELVPAFRGVSCVILEQMYVSAFTPYLKPWAFFMTRTDITTRGEEQWHVEKARIGLSSSEWAEYSGWLTYIADLERVATHLTDTTFLERWNGDFENLCEECVEPNAFGTPLWVCDTDFDIAVAGTGRFYPSIESTGFSSQAELNDWISENGASGPSGQVQSQGQASGVMRGFCLLYDFDIGQWRSRDDPDFTVGYKPNRLVVRDSIARLNGGDAFNAIYCPAGSFPLIVARDASVDQTSTSTYAAQTCVPQFWDEDPPVWPVPVIVDQPLCADMNPAHIIRECLTDKEWGMGYSAADIDEASFIAAADTLYDEQMGISILWQRENTIESFVQDIVRHIEAALYVDRRTGKFVLKLIRNDYDESALITLGPDQIERVENYKRPAFGDLVNSVTVIYDDCNDGKGVNQ